MTKPKPLDAAEVVQQASDVALIQFDAHVTDEQRRVALYHVRDLITRKYTEDTNLIIGIAIGWAAAQ